MGVGWKVHKGGLFAIMSGESAVPSSKAIWTSLFVYGRQNMWVSMNVVLEEYFVVLLMILITEKSEKRRNLNTK